MTEIRMFDTREAATVAGWAGSVEESMVWCSLPDVGADTVIAWAEQPDVEAFLLVDGDPRAHGGHVVGYGEIWIDPSENEVELAHLIVAPGQRRRGLGRRLVDGLVEQAWRHYPAVSLRVHSQNEAAIRCYSAAGFVRASESEETAWNAGQPIDYVWMCRHR